MAGGADRIAHGFADFHASNQPGAQFPGISDEVKQQLNPKPPSPVPAPQHLGLSLSLSLGLAISLSRFNVLEDVNTSKCPVLPQALQIFPGRAPQDTTRKKLRLRLRLFRTAPGGTPHDATLRNGVGELSPRKGTHTDGRATPVNAELTALERGMRAFDFWIRRFRFSYDFINSVFNTNLYIIMLKFILKKSNKKLLFCILFTRIDFNRRFF